MCLLKVYGFAIIKNSQTPNQSSSKKLDIQVNKTPKVR